MSGKSLISQGIAKLGTNRELLTEDYMRPNKYLPLFYANMRKNGLVYNPFAYGTQLIFMQNRVRRERLCVDRGKFYLVDRSIFEDRHIFAYVYRKLGVISQDEYNDYRNIFEKLVRSIETPDVLVFLNTDPVKCYEMIKKQGNKVDDWVPLELLQEFDYCYRHRLTERLLLHNPNIHIIEVDPFSYEDSQDAVQYIDKKIEEALGEKWASTRYNKTQTGQQKILN